MRRQYPCVRSIFFDGDSIFFVRTHTLKDKVNRNTQKRLKSQNIYLSESLVTFITRYHEKNKILIPMIERLLILVTKIDNIFKSDSISILRFYFSFRKDIILN